ncbi:MAG TPA: desulfoferrodoxin [Clostridiales bacterium]|nr:desulfoferrodoxin [Clostridiales bacterium]HQP70634.1 desulfoferrodoxin [Clostridiales bacterium]
MAKFQKFYKCALCGNIVEVVHEGGGDLVCCGQPMNLINENSVDASNEKHVPVIEKTDKGILVKVGSIDHPMEEKHYIEWIEVTNGAWTQKKYLKPGDKPQAEFCVQYSDKLVAKEYCNIHGLWIK